MPPSSWRDLVQTRTRETQPPAEESEPADAPTAALLALQRSAGNAAVARALARSADPARTAFFARGLMPSAAGLDFQSATGGGGFNVVYDPRVQQLSVHLRVGFDFRNSLRMAGGRAVAVTTDFDTDAANVNANLATPVDRAAEVTTNWQWSAAEKQQWSTDFATMVRDVWGAKHYFVADSWADVFAGVDVTVDTHMGHLPDDHCQATVFKVPPGSVSGPGPVTGYKQGDPFYNPMTLTSANLGVTYDHVNYPIQFPVGSADLTQAVAASPEGHGDAGDVLVGKLVVDLQPGTPGGGAEITVTGHASTSGGAEGNKDLSLRRAEAVANHLEASGPGIDPARIAVNAEGEAGAGSDVSWQRVDIKIGGGEGQKKAAHEVGHVFGLGDEYTSPVGGTAPDPSSPAIGTPTDHAGLPPMGGGVPPAVYENNDNIMSVGNVVRPQHYITFLEALNTITAPVHFSYGGEGEPPAYGIYGSEDPAALPALVP